MVKKRDVPTTHCTCTFNTHRQVTLAPFPRLVQISGGNSFSHVKFRALGNQAAAARSSRRLQLIPSGRPGSGTYWSLWAHWSPSAACFPFLHPCPLAQHICPVPLATGLLVHPCHQPSRTTKQCSASLSCHHPFSRQGWGPGNTARPHDLQGPLAWEWLSLQLDELGEPEGKRGSVPVLSLFKNLGPKSIELQKHPAFLANPGYTERSAPPPATMSYKGAQSFLAMHIISAQGGASCPGLFTLCLQVWKPIILWLQFQSHCLWPFPTTPFSGTWAGSPAASAVPPHSPDPL